MSLENPGSVVGDELWHADVSNLIEVCSGSWPTAKHS